MTRNFSYLAAALGMLTFAGCGEVPNSAAVATNTVALKPLPPAPEDKDMPVTPTPLAPSALLPAGAPTGEPAGTQPTNTTPAVAAPPIGQPAAAPPNTAAGSAAPPSNSGGGLFQNLFGGTDATKTTTPAAPSNAPVDTSTEIALSGATVARTNAAEGHFQVAYAFTRGAPVPSLWYTLVFRQDPEGGHEAPESATKIQGGNLQQQGTLNGIVSMPGRSPRFEISVWEGPSREDKGHKISVAITAAVHREFTKVEKNSVPMNPSGRPSANGPTSVQVGSAFWRIDADTVRFEAVCDFGKTRPDPDKWYFVVVSEQGSNSTGQHASSTKFAGNALRLVEVGVDVQTKLVGDVRLGGKAGELAAQLVECDSEQDAGHPISSVHVGEFVRRAPPVNGSPAPPATDAQAIDSGITRPAGVGVGAQGKGYGSDILTAPVATLFSVKEKIAFKIQIPQAMKFFEAQNNRKPNSHEEFMEKIIKDNQITLPELPAGEKYIYDPQKGELMYTLPKK